MNDLPLPRSTPDFRPFAEDALLASPLLQFPHVTDAGRLVGNPNVSKSDELDRLIARIPATNRDSGGDMDASFFK